jgi:ketosteroid isomerase-like protein
MMESIRTTEQTVNELNGEVSRAYLAGNAERLAEIFDERFLFTNPLGHVLDREQELAQVRAGNLECDTFETHDVSIRLYADTAIVCGLAVVKGSYQQRDMTGHYRFTRVFVRRGDRWTLASAHGTKREAPELRYP